MAPTFFFPFLDYVLSIVLQCIILKHIELENFAFLLYVILEPNAHKPTLFDQIEDEQFLVLYILDQSSLSACISLTKVKPTYRKKLQVHEKNNAPGKLISPFKLCLRNTNSRIREKTNWIFYKMQ